MEEAWLEEKARRIADWTCATCGELNTDVCACARVKWSQRHGISETDPRWLTQRADRLSKLQCYDCGEDHFGFCACARKNWLRDYRVKQLDLALHGDYTVKGLIRWPMAKIRETFTAEDAQNWWTASHRKFDTFHVGFCSVFYRQSYEVDSAELEKWFLEAATWLVDECRMPLNAFLRTTDESNLSYALDCMFNAFLMYPRVKMLWELFSKRGAKPYKSYSFLFCRFCFTSRLYYARLDYELVIKLFLDCGARLESVFVDEFSKIHRHVTIPERQINDWYENRLLTRSVVIAFLGCRKRCERMRHYLAPDIARLIGKMIWENRFENYRKE